MSLEAQFYPGIRVRVEGAGVVAEGELVEWEHRTTFGESTLHARFASAAIVIQGPFTVTLLDVAEARAIDGT